MHTPEQAKELWCPMSRVAMAHRAEDETDYTIDPAVYNRVAIKSKPTTIPKSCNCMADKCAMWRWPNVTNEPTTYGYCGLSPLSDRADPGEAA